MGRRGCILVKERRCQQKYCLPSVGANLLRYTYAASFATQIITAAGFTEYWALAQVYQTVVFYVLAPLTILFINFAGVFVGLPEISKSWGNWTKACSILVGSRPWGDFSKYAWLLEAQYSCM